LKDVLRKELDNVYRRICRHDTMLKVTTVKE
jgi:hypothetical protein